MTNEMRRRLITLLGIADRATDAKQQSAFTIGDPEQTMGMGEIATLLSAHPVAFQPAVCGMLVWIALAADVEGAHGTKAWAGLRVALEGIPDIDDPFMWSCDLKDAFENAGFDFDKREWKADKDDDTPAEFDFSKAQRGKYADWGKDGYSYPCDPCRHTGQVRVCAACGQGACWHGENLCEESRSASTVMAPCPKCDGVGRIVVTAEEAKAERAEAEPVREAARERLRRELEVPPECGCEPDPDMVHDESCPAWCGEPKEGA